MIQSDKTKILILLCMLICCLIGCSYNDIMKKYEVGKENVEPSETDQEARTSVAKPASYSIVTENKEYGLTLPEAEAFRDILQDFIYWEYATMIEKDGGISIFRRLEEENCLETELKIHFYYRECDREEMDYGERNIYNIIVIFPANKSLSYFSLEYNARGLSSDYDYGYGGWFSDHLDSLDMDISSQKLEKNKWFRKQYTSFGAASLLIKKEEAEAYTVKDRFPVGEKEQILAAIQKAVKKEYKKANNQIVYIRDFLPGDESLSGEVINLDIKSKDDMPLFWVKSFIHYSGAKMEEFEDIYWDTHYSSGYSGAGQPHYNPTLKQVKKWAKEENEAINVEKCILAYRIKDGGLIDLKHVDENISEEK